MENIVKLKGKVITEATESGRYDYEFILKVSRSNSKSDDLIIKINKDLLNYKLNIDQLVEVIGYVESENRSIDNSKKLIIYTRATEINPIEEITDKDVNYVALEGVLCSKPNYRTTPSGTVASDMMVVCKTTNGTYEKSNYIPVLLWNESAEKSRDFVVSNGETESVVKVLGVMRARIYKKIINGQSVEKVAYEISGNLESYKSTPREK